MRDWHGLFTSDRQSNRATESSGSSNPSAPLPPMLQATNDRAASTRYSVTVNRRPVPVQTYNSLNYVQFSFAGRADIAIDVDQPISTHRLSPIAYRIPAKVTGNRLSFSLTAPRKLILHKINGLPEPLIILAESVEENVPSLGSRTVVNVRNFGVDNTGTTDVTARVQRAIDFVSSRRGVLYFPPGTYSVQQINLRSNMTFYLAAGATLVASKNTFPSYGKGLLFINGASNVQIRGRGAINGNGSFWRSRGGWYSLIEIRNSRNINLSEITLIDPAVANITMLYAENLNLYNVKILAAPNPRHINTDGFIFWSSRNILVDNVLYWGTDDATSHGGDRLHPTLVNNENINIRNSVFHAGGAFKIGTTVKQSVIRNITYENIDVVAADELSGLWPVTGANFENIFFKNIRLEEILNPTQAGQEWGSASMLQWRIKEAEWEPQSTANTLGSIRNVFVQNLTVFDPGRNRSTFQGYDRQRNIQAVFENLSIRGRIATNLNEAFFSVLPSEKDNGNYVNLQFIRSVPTIVNITTLNPTASEGRAAARFQVTRSGNLSRSLRVTYQVRGTAIAGQDYPDPPRSVTIPAGAASAPIVIQPRNDGRRENVETILLSLENQPHDRAFMLGSNFHAMATIRD
jgi:hypothetical protein